MGPATYDTLSRHLGQQSNVIPPTFTFVVPLLVLYYAALTLARSRQDRMRRSHSETTLRDLSSEPRHAFCLRHVYACISLDCSFDLAILGLDFDANGLLSVPSAFLETPCVALTQLLAELELQTFGDAIGWSPTLDSSTAIPSARPSCEATRVPLAKHSKTPAVIGSRRTSVALRFLEAEPVLGIDLSIVTQVLVEVFTTPFRTLEQARPVSDSQRIQRFLPYYDGCFKRGRPSTPSTHPPTHPRIRRPRPHP